MHPRAAGRRSRIRPSWRLHDLEYVSVRIADQEPLREAQLAPAERDRARGDKRRARLAERACGIAVAADQAGLPVHHVVGALVGRDRPAVARRQVLEELDAGPARGPQRGDAQPGAEHAVQVLLLGPVVLALALHLESQEIAIEAEARRRVGGDDRRVVDAEEQPRGRPLPPGVAPPERALQDLADTALR